MGGLSKKAWVIEAALNDNIPFLLVDSGNLLFKRGNIPQGPVQEKVTATGIMSAYSSMQYDAVAVGPKDLSAGIDFISHNSPLDFPWISANLITPTGALPFPAYVIKEINGLRLAIVGLTGKSQKSSSYSTRSWQDVLPPLMSKLSGEVDLTLLLSTLPMEDNHTISKSYPDLLLIISGDKRYGNRSPKLIGNSLITQTTSQGKYLGKLDITPGSMRKWSSNLHILLANNQKRLSELEDRKERILNRLADPTLSSPALLRIEKKIQKMQEEVGKIEQTIANRQTSGTTYYIFESQFIAMSKKHKESKQINTLISKIKKQIRELNVKLSHKMRDDIKNNTALDNIAGKGRCAECHEKQYDFWKDTDHSHAFSTLVEKGQAYDLACLPCHVTYNPDSLPDEADKTVLLSLGSDHLSVGCEACHGPLSDHADSPEKVFPPNGVYKNNCLRCHTIERDDNFNFSQEVKVIQCPSD